MKRAKEIAKILEELYPAPPIPLVHKDAYTLLIAVLLSASCTDARVNQTTPALFQLADTAEKMALVDVEAVERIIRPLGLSQAKSKNIVALSRIICERHKGMVPQTFEELEELPGVGHKTASVVMAQAFHVPAFPVDTHIFRCARRWGLSKGRTVATVERDLKRLFPENEWIQLHLRIIYFAREYCQAVKHNPVLCPICSKL